jgi:tRNA 5-methylaminomethyl-2-thiouridine biosynthesis bifunctional protein
MLPHKVDFNGGALRSLQYDDIFFSPTNALAEIQHVFLNNNTLAKSWQEAPYFTLAETGFGTGLNCLMAWDLFEKTSSDHQHLHIISFENHPLHRADLIKSLTPFNSHLGSKIDRLIDVYPPLIKGEHRLWLSSQVSLTLIFDECTSGLARLDHQVDAWFLDGFAPSKNPSMWTLEIFKQMARLSHDTTTFTTFTVAGIVKRGLTECGFHVEKVPGYGNKNENLQGRFTKNKRIKKTIPKSIAIVGSGLAGAACAYTFAKRNISVDIFDQNPQPALETSSHKTMLINPRANVTPTSTSELINQGFSLTLNHLNDLKKNNHIPHYLNGNLHLANTPIKQKRYKKMIDSNTWHKDHMKLLSAPEASDTLGIKVHFEALFYPDAGQFSPQDLIKAYLNQPNIQLHLNTQVVPSNTTLKNRNLLSITLEKLSTHYDKVILCNGINANILLKEFGFDFPIIPTRGQTTLIKFDNLSLSHAISHGGFCTATDPFGIATIGPTYDTSRDTPDILPKDNDFNINKLISALPELENNFHIIGQWAGVRMTTLQRDPIYGHLYNNVYAALALGSHGATLHSILADKVFLKTIQL